MTVETPDRTLAGYRVLRTLARGARCEIVLGFDPWSGDGSERTVALKVGPRGDTATARELEALERGRGDHVVALLDYFADDEREGLVLERLGRGDLGELLARRQGFSGGEAVTLLAPLVSTVERLHAMGVAHGSLAASSVMFRDDGTPVLTGFGESRVFAPGAPEVMLESIPEVAADRAALRRLAAEVLGRVEGSRSRTARAFATRLETVEAGDLIAMLSSGIFEVAAAMPVRWDPGDESPESSSRVVPIAAPQTERSGSDAPWQAALTGLIEQSPLAGLRAAARARWTALSTVRRRMLVAVGMAGITVIVAVVSIPSGQASTPSPAASPRTPRSTPVSPDAVVQADDPVAAAMDLLKRRAGCRRDLSVLCLESVDQDGSAAMVADRGAILSARAGGELVNDQLDGPDVLAPALGERLGDSALVTLGAGGTTPSLLLMRSDGGWRIRDVLMAPGAAPSAG